MAQGVTDFPLAIFTKRALHGAGADVHPAIGSPALGMWKSIGGKTSKRVIARAQVGGPTLGRKSGLKKPGRVIKDSQPDSPESEEPSE